MIIKNIFIIKLLLIFLCTSMLTANINGIVFQDLPVNAQILNNYGVQDSNELGVQNILVTAFPDNISTTTDSNGTWSLNTTQDSRIEFSNIPSYLKESIQSTQSNTSVQFIPNNTNNIKFALHSPADFSETANPYYVSNLQQNGTHDSSTLQNLQTVQYNASALNADFKTHTNIQGTGEIPQDTILMDKLGSIWGKAYQKNKKRLFVASMLQRHVGFANTPADIYVTDYTGGTPSSLLGNFSLQGKVPSNGGSPIDLGTVDRASGSDYTLTNDPLLQNIDLDSYAKVGKISYGGIDIDHNTNTLWLLNLNQKGLISIDVSGSFSTLTTATINQYVISNLTNKPICTNGELRPWAIKIHKDKGYIGAICDASISKSTNDLSAHIFSFKLSNPSLGFTKELDFQLDYSRQLRNWYAWENTYFDPTHPKAYNGVIYGQPVLSDIEFDKSDNMYIAFFDRYSTQLGTGNYRALSGTVDSEFSYEYGEILKVCNINGTYEREGTGNCTQSNYTDLGISEFFNDQGGDRNRESSLGALALLKGSNQLLLTTTDPHPESTSGISDSLYWFTQGTHTLSTIDGSIENWYSFALTSIKGLNSKANGLGDIELITEAAPIEIGDKIWFDANTNGIQDANETGISGVNIELDCNNITVATAITDNNGNYIFSNDPRTTSTTSHIYGITALIENTNQCYIRIPNIDGNNKQPVLSSKMLTSNNVGEGSNTNLNDSNGIPDNNNSKVLILPSDIPIAGHNNHSFDVGFKPLVNLLTLGDRVWIDSNQDGIQDINETGINGITVNLYTNTDCSGTVSQTTQTANLGLYQFNNLIAGNYCLEFKNLPSNYVISPANQGTDDSLNSDTNSSGAIPNINLTATDLTYDLGIYSTPLILNTANVQIGNRVWLENDNDGNANTGIVSPIIGQIVIATSSNGTPYSSTTDSNGLYLITVPKNDTYIVTLNPPTNYVATGNSNDNNITESVLENNFSHDAKGTTVVVTTINNLTVDFGFRLTSVLGTTVCQNMTANDDIQNANEFNATTTIDALSNDAGSKAGQVIKFLSLSEGKTLWENRTQNISTATTLDTLTVPGEGTWSILNNKIVFIALLSFDGKIPTPIYYIVQGIDCTAATQFSNVAKVTINTPCNCIPYTTKSVNALSLLSLLLLILLTLTVTHYNMQKNY